MAKVSARSLPVRRRQARTPVGSERQPVSAIRKRKPSSSRSARSTFYRYRRDRSAVLTLAWVLLAVAAFLLVAALHTHGGPVRVAPAPRPAQVPLERALPARTRLDTPAQANLSLAGPPSLSAPLVDGILAAYGSPLHGHGAALVALSRRYGIDDAVALGFFVMESRAGTQGEAISTHSFGNLRPMPGAPAADGYRAYGSWVESAGEWFRVLRSLYLDNLKLTSVEAVVPVYAPASDSNDPPTMIAGIRQLVRCWRGDPAHCPDDPPGVRALVAATHPSPDTHSQ